MTTSSDEAPGSRFTGWQRAMLRLGHLYGRFSTLCLLSLLALNTAQLWLPDDAQRNIAGDIALVASLVYVGGSMLRDRYHGRMPCTACLDLEPWLDPQGAVEKHDRQLRLWHHPWYRRGLVLILGWFVMTTLFSATITGTNHQLPVPHWVGASIGTALYLVLFVAIRTAFNAGNQHKRLRPWCPGCRNGGRGPRARITPQPSPEPANA